MRRFLLLAALPVVLRAADPTPVTIPAGAAAAVFSGGCFWCIQPPFDKAPGVISTLVGYTGGTKEYPTYEEVSSGETGHRESIEVFYDPTKISYGQLLEIFWRNINPTQTDGQFYDVGSQYTTAIYYVNDAEKQQAAASKEALAKSGKFKDPIVTQILPLTKFWPAESYHQKYSIKNPDHYQAYHQGSGRNTYFDETWGKK